MSGRSNCSHRTDDLVSGNRTQTSAVAFALWLLPCATVAVPAIATSASPTAGMIFFTPVPFVGASGWWARQNDTEPPG